MNLERALEIEGFTSRVELEWLAKQASNKRRIVEVGCWMGRSTRALADNMPEDSTLFAVDHWLGSNEEAHINTLKDKPIGWLLEKFQENMKGARCKNIYICQGYSGAFWDGVGNGHKCDFIFIDASHDYSAVRADIQGWLKQLSPGGTMAGHDYDGGRPGVVKAVKELLPNAKPAGAGSIWYMGSLV